MSAHTGHGFDAPGEVPCCWGSINGTDCTCWEKVLDPEPTLDLQEGPSPIQPLRCSDCAFRRDSPEQKDGTILPVDVEHVFWCHQPLAGSDTLGLPVVVGYRHGMSHIGDPGTGEFRAAPHGDSYEPVQSYGQRTWNADETPAAMCAGWAGRAGVSR